MKSVLGITETHKYTNYPAIIQTLAFDCCLSWHQGAQGCLYCHENIVTIIYLRKPKWPSQAYVTADITGNVPQRKLAFLLLDIQYKVVKLCFPHYSHVVW